MAKVPEVHPVPSWNVRRTKRFTRLVLTGASMDLRTIPIFLAFFLMGLADAMGPNSDKIKAAYDLNDVTSTLPTFAVFIAFAVFSVPGGLLAARIGKKYLLLLGLGLNALALVLPSILVPPFLVVLGCIFLLGVGTTFLQVAGN